MRILLATHQFLPDFHGGTEVLVFEVARELGRRGHDVRILTGWPGRSPDPTAIHDHYVHHDLVVHRIHSSLPVEATAAQRVAQDADSPAAVAAFEEIVASWRPDVLHAYHLQRLSAAIPAACLRLRIPSMYTPTDFWAACALNQLRLPDGRPCAGADRDSINCIAHLAVQGTRSYLAPMHRWLPLGALGLAIRLLPADAAAGGRVPDAIGAIRGRPAAMQRMLGAFTLIGASTPQMANVLEACGADPHRIRRLPFGIDTTPFAAAKPVGTAGCLRVGFIGSLHEHKGAQVLIEAVKRLDAAAQISVNLFGDEGADPAFVRRIKALAGNDARIAFRGTFDRSETARVLDEIDVVVVPSTWNENTPLVVFAALAAGRPVVGSDVPGIAELIEDGVNGRLFRQGDVRALEGILADLIARPTVLAALAQAVKPPRSIERYVDDLSDAYGTLLRDDDVAVADSALRETVGTRYP